MKHADEQPAHRPMSQLGVRTVHRAPTRGVRVALALAVALALGGCAGGPPGGWAPSSSESATDPYGAWARVRDTSGHWVCEGELLAVTADTLWIFADTSGVRSVSLSGVQRVRVYRYGSESIVPAGFALLGAISTLSHGWWLIISAPVWVLTGVFTAGIESAAARIDVTPGEWVALRRYVRWPGGWPQDLDRRDVRPKPVRRRDPQQEAWPRGG